MISLSLTLVFTGSSAAFAHTVLIGSDPVANSTITQLPEEIKLTFADPLLVLGKRAINAVEVIDPMGHLITSSDNVVKGALLTNVLAPKSIMQGLFHVNFRVVAQDGHILSGSFSFSVGSKTKTPTLTRPLPKGIVHITALANAAGLMEGTGAPNESAKISIDLNFSNQTVCYFIKTSVKNILAVHIHSMNQTNMTISDEIFLPLNIASINAKKPLCDQVPLTVLTALYYSTSHYMAMFHTKAFPNGAIAGELTR